MIPLPPPQNLAEARSGINAGNANSISNIDRSSNPLSILTSVLFEEAPPFSNIGGSTSPSTAASGRLSSSSSLASFSTAPSIRRSSLLLGDYPSSSGLSTTEALALPKSPNAKDSSTSAELVQSHQHSSSVTASSLVAAASTRLVNASFVPLNRVSPTQQQQQLIQAQQPLSAPLKMTNNTDNKPNKLQIDQFWQVIRQEAITVVMNDAPSSRVNDSFAATASTLLKEEEEEQLLLDEETLRGITQRPSGAWQAQIYYASKTRYIGCFESKMMAARVYQWLRDRLKKKKGKKNGATAAAGGAPAGLYQRKPKAATVNKAPMRLAPQVTERAARRLSETSSASAMPPLKKRKVQDMKDLTGQAPAAGAQVTVDNTYQPPPIGVAATATATSSANAAASYFFGGAGYAPLLPPHPRQGPAFHQNQQLRNLQPIQMMMPPPPPPFNGHFFHAMGGFLPQNFAHPAAAMIQMQSQATGAFPMPHSHVANNFNLSTSATKSTTSSKKANPSSDPARTAANDNEWKTVRKEVMDQIKSGMADGAAPVTMDNELLRGITQRPSGKYQAQMYFAGQSRYIGVFESKEKAAVAYEMIRKKIKPPQFGKSDATVSLSLSPTCGNQTTTRAPALAAAKQLALQRGSMAMSNNRAITPSPTTVGGKHARSFSAAVAMAAPSYVPIAPTGVVSPLAKNKPATSTDRATQAMAPII